MTSVRLGAELLTLRKYAEELAQRRKERLSSVHLLAAIAAKTSAAADLLHERRLSEAFVLLGAVTAREEAPDAVTRSLERARAVASRMGSREPGSAHLLLALLNDSRGAARSVLEQSGTDLGRLRTAALNL